MCDLPGHPTRWDQTAELGTFRRDLGCGNTIKLNSGAQNGCSGAEFQIPTSLGCGLGAGERPAGGDNQSDNIYTVFKGVLFS